MGNVIRKKWRLALAGLVFVFLIYVCHPLYLAAIGNFLVVSDVLDKADIIPVLDGDSARDERLIHAISSGRRDIYISASPYSYFRPDDWWRHRADSRTLLLEFTKTLWYALFE